MCFDFYKRKNISGHGGHTKKPRHSGVRGLICYCHHLSDPPNRRQEGEAHTSEEANKAVVLLRAVEERCN